jgi:hypothetical protein
MLKLPPKFVSVNSEDVVTRKIVRKTSKRGDWFTGVTKNSLVTTVTTPPY